MRAARSAGRRPETAPITSAAPIPPSQATRGTTTSPTLYVGDQLVSLSAQLVAAAQATSDPIDALLGAWRAYVEFGRAHPTKYRVIFERRFLDLWDAEQRPMAETLPLLTGTIEMMIGHLQTCIDTGCSVSVDALTDSVAIWYFVHGMVALPSTITSFAWPAQATHLDQASPT